MSPDEQPSSVAAALQQVEELRAAAQARQQSQLGEIDEEIGRLEQSIENLRAQVATLHEARRAAQEEAQSTLNSSSSASQHVFEALRVQSGRLTERNTAWVEAKKALESTRREALQSSEVAPLLQEYEQFHAEVEPTLANLPESYRKVIQAHHETVKSKLQAHLDALQSFPDLTDDELALDVVVAGDEGIAMVLTPVSESLYSDWSGRPADLESRVAEVVVEGLYTALRGTALESAEAAFGGHEGLLVMEVELTSDLAGFAGRLDAAMRQVFESAADVTAANVLLNLVRVPVDLLLPADEDPEDYDA